MKRFAVLAIGVLALGLSGCRDRAEVTADETRRVTMRDRDLKLDATNAERFGAAMRSAPGMPQAPIETPVVATVVPEGWSEAPGSAMRLLNYRVGHGGEAYVSLSRGGVLDNVNRWRRQFGLAPIDAAGLAGLEEIELPEHKGVWIEAEGEYGAGMGAEAKSGYALAGVVASKGEEILTVKMVGPRGLVAEQREALRRFVGGLKKP